MSKESFPDNYKAQGHLSHPSNQGRVARAGETDDFENRGPEPSHLSAPVITEAVNGELQVNELGGDVHMTVVPWRSMAKGQALYLRFEGIQQDGSLLSWMHYWQGKLVKKKVEQHTLIVLNKLKQLKADSQLKIILELLPSPGADRIAFPVQTYIIKGLNTILDFGKEKDILLHAGRSYTMQGFELYVHEQPQAAVSASKITEFPESSSAPAGTRGLFFDHQSPSMYRPWVEIKPPAPIKGASMTLYHDSGAVILQLYPDPTGSPDVVGQIGIQVMAPFAGGFEVASHHQVPYDYASISIDPGRQLSMQCSVTRIEFEYA